jgi:putative DNA primase/helicase
MEEINQGQHALEAAKVPFDVFPLRARDKRPIARGWQSSATHDPEIVERYWHEHPEANIGIKTGGGLVVLDADSPTGEAALRDFGLPPTTTVSTGRGKHFYLHTTTKIRNRGEGFLPDVHVRGDGGFIVGAGSQHPDGPFYRYVISPAEVPPAPVPAALAELFSRENRRSLDPSSP